MSIKYSRTLILSTVALASLMLAACGSSDSTANLGSRDDIIVNNRNMPKEAMEQAVATKLETVQQDAAMMTAEKIESQPATPVPAVVDSEAARLAAQQKVIEEANKAAAAATAATSDGLKTMKTTPMGLVESPTPQVESQGTSQAAAAPVAPAGMDGDVPPNAKPGECYAKVLIPAVKDTKQERVQISEEQRVLARMIPARYDVQTERVLVKEARQYWKAGHGPVTRQNEVTGEIMCLVEEPAEYKTIEKRVLVEPEKPEYKVVPAQFETITKVTVIKPERWEWRRILCETNMGADSIARIQRALVSKGYKIAVDGKFGNDTLNAINDYSAKNGLPSRGITYETLEHLGVRLIGA